MPGESPPDQSSPAPRPWAAALGLTVAVLVTVGSWAAWDQAARDQHRREADTQAGALAIALEHEVRSVVTHLQAADAFLVRDRAVDRRAWWALHESLVRGTDGTDVAPIGYAPRIDAAEVPAHEAALRAEGIPEYTVSPPVLAPWAAPVARLEPFTGPATRLLGVDLQADHGQRPAMQAAAQSGQPALAIGGDHGPVLYLAVYDPDHPHRTAVERQQATVGWVFALVDAEALVDRAMRHLPEGAGAEVLIGPADHASVRVVHDAAGNLHEASHERIVALVGQDWRVRYAGAPTRPTARIVAATLAMAALVAQALWAVASYDAHRRLIGARNAADVARQALLSARRAHNDVQRQLAAGHWAWVPERVHLELSDTLMMQLPRRTSTPATPEALFAALFGGGSDADDALRRLIDHGVPFNEVWKGTLGGHPRWIRGQGTPQRDPTTGRRQFLGTLQDVTAQHLVEQELAESRARMEGVFESARDGIFLATAEGRYAFANPAGLAMLGYSLDELRARTIPEVVAESERPRLPSHFARLQAGHAETTNWTLLRKDRTRVSAEIVAQSLPDGSLLSVVRDITERADADRRLRESEAQHRQLLGALRDGVVILDADGSALFQNEAATEILGDLPTRIFRGAPPPNVRLVREDGSEFPVEALPAQRTIRGGGPQRGVIVGLAAEGQPNRWWMVNTAALDVDLDGNAWTIAVSFADVTARLQDAERLRLFASVFDHAHEGIVVTDDRGVIVEVNAPYTALTGYTREELIGINPRRMQSGRHGPTFYREMWERITREGRWVGEIWNRRRTGEIYPQQTGISAVRNLAGRVTHFVGMVFDLTATKAVQSRLEQHAFYDALTHLPNRVLLGDRLDQALARTRRDKSLLAVCYLDLDGFKAVNDTAGHAAGDRLLVEVGQRLQGCVRDEDTIARLGGDEFVLLLECATGVADIEEVLRRVTAAISAPYSVGDGAIANVSASIGYTVAPEDPADAENLVRHADQAMYQAKQGGKNGFARFDVASAERNRHAVTLAQRLTLGLESGEFDVRIHPIVHLRRQVALGGEVLLRWNHPERGVLAAAEFVSEIESSDLAHRFGAWILDRTVRELAAWHNEGYDGFLSVNLWARQLEDPRFISTLAEVLARYPEVDPLHLELEIRETTALGDLQRVEGVIRECRRLGVRMALDNFGTGYSSMTYLKRLSADTLKIDGSFVSTMHEDPDALAIVEAILGLAQGFRRTVIAEGLNHGAAAILLQQLGCDRAQGYAIAPPMTADEFAAWRVLWRSPADWRTEDAAMVPRRQLGLLRAEVEHRAWCDAVKAAIRSPQPVEPPADGTHCRLSRWMSAENRAYRDLPEWEVLRAAHDDVHALAEQMLGGEATADIDRLNAARDALIGALRSLRKTASLRDPPTGP